MSTIAACWIGSSRPTAPKSISPSVPSSSTNTLPGCGSAWKKPRRITWSSIERSSWSASARRSTPIGVEAGGVGHRPALEALLDEDPPRAQLAVERRHADRRVAVEPGGHLGHRVGLAPEVELLAQPAGELGEHVAGAHASAERGAPLGEVGEQGERGEVALHRRLDARALDLDDDGLAGAQPGAVGLADRRGGERLPVELGEHRVEVVAELGGEHSGDALARLGRHPVLQRRQLGAHVARQQVDAGRGDLAELDVDPAGLLEHAAQAHRLALEVGGSARTATARSPRAGRGGRAPGSGGTRAMRRRTARSGRGATTSPARSPIASEPGRASRSRATAAVIVAGIPIATRCSTRPSAPQSQRFTPSATVMATPQPSTPASSAVPHPRRMPSSRSDTLVMSDAKHDAEDDADGDAECRRHDDSRSSRSSRAGRRPGAAQHEARVAARTSSTSSARGWKARAASSATIADASTSPSNSKRYVTQAPSDEVRAHGAQAPAAAARPRSNRRMPGSSLGTSVASSTAHAPGGRRRDLDGVVARLVGVEPEPAFAAVARARRRRSSRPGARRRTARRWRSAPPGP